MKKTIAFLALSLFSLGCDRALDAPAVELPDAGGDAGEVRPDQGRPDLVPPVCGVDGLPCCAPDGTPAVDPAKLVWGVPGCGAGLVCEVGWTTRCAPKF